MLGPDPGGTSHPAVFPRELVRRCVLLSSRPGDLILDPFSGSGTTGVVAVELNRRAVLIELNETYAEQSKARIDSGLQRILFPQPEQVAARAKQ